MFRDRREAGAVLATRLPDFAHNPDVVVLALPRGGVPVAEQVARALDAPLDIFLVRKIGLPQHEEFAIGALASGGLGILDRSAARRYGVSEEAIADAVKREWRELDRRETVYRGGEPPLDVRGKTVILVDDGLATGSSMRAAILALRRLEPARIVVAVPVAPAATCRDLESVADRVVCTETPEPFQAVGVWYDDFEQTTDREVRDSLAAARARRSARPAERREP